MMKKNKLLTTLITAALTLSLIACSSGSADTSSSASTDAAQNTSSAETADSSQNTPAETTQETASEPVHLKIGTAAPESSTFVSYTQRFVDKLSELSGGTMTADIVAGGALGNIVQHFAQLNEGTLDIFVQGLDAPAAVPGGEDFNILNVPFLFNDNDHFHAFVGSDVFAAMMAKVQEENNFSFLGLMGDRPARSLSTTNTPVRTPDDMKGLVLRVPESAVPVAVFQAWGANTTTSAPAAIFEGLQSGQFDGQDNGIETMVVDGFMEVQNYYMSFDHTQQGIAAFISNATLDKFSAEQRAWVDEALEYAYAEAYKELWEDQVPGYRDTMTANGVTIVDDIDKDAFIAIVADLVPQFEGDYFREGLYDEIRALAQ